MLPTLPSSMIELSQDCVWLEHDTTGVLVRHIWLWLQLVMEEIAFADLHMVMLFPCIMSGADQDLWSI